MTAYRGVLLDLDGVLYVGREPLTGAARALARLREAGLPLGFVTNTTRRSRRGIRADLGAMGFAIVMRSCSRRPGPRATGSRRTGSRRIC